MNPLISVIIPVFKVEEYLERCVNSVLNQSYQNLEIILVDDGSPDNCGKICDEFAKKDRRIKVIHKENGGLSDARNAGIGIATGNYMGFVDSDDFIHPDMYQILIDNLKQHNADISICGYKTTKSSEIAPITNTDIKTYSNLEALEELHTFKVTEFTLAWNKLYKTELFRNIRYPKGKNREDEFTTYKLLYKATKIVYIQSELYYYFQSPNSIMREASLQKESFYAEALEERIDFFYNKSLFELYSMATRRYCLWLLSLCSTYSKELSNESLLSFFISARNKYLRRVVTLKALPRRTKSFYYFAMLLPNLAGKIAFHKLNRYNKISRTFDFIFADPPLYRP